MKYKWAKYNTRGDLIRSCGIHSQGFFPGWRAYEAHNTYGGDTLDTLDIKNDKSVSFRDSQFGSAFFNNTNQDVRLKDYQWVDPLKGQERLKARDSNQDGYLVRNWGKTWYAGPEPARFFFFDLNGKALSEKADSKTYKGAYSAGGFTHPGLGRFLSEMSLVLPVHGLLMHNNKKSKNLAVTAEHSATGQLVQALLMNEGYNQIFSYLFTQKNCEKRDITHWTNLYQGSVKNDFTDVEVKSIRDQLEATQYSKDMRKTTGETGQFIGSYKGQARAMTTRYDDAVADWTTAKNSVASSNGTYEEDAEYSLYRWTYFFDYEEQDYSAGPELASTPDARFGDEETRLANAILWLRDYDNSQQRRRNLLESTYLINRFSYPDANQDGQKFINAETHSKKIYS